MIRSGPRTAVLFLCVLAIHALHAQDDDVFVFGTVRDLVGRTPLPDAYVVLSDPSAANDTVWADDNGAYEVTLDFDQLHDLRYCAPGKIGKRIIIDVGNTPDEERVGGLGMNVEMILFSPLPGKDYSFLSGPFGIARYAPSDTMVLWDLALTDSMRALLLPLTPDTVAKEPAVPATTAPARSGLGTLEVVIVLVMFFVLLVPAVVVTVRLIRRRKQ